MGTLCDCVAEDSGTHHPLKINGLDHTLFSTLVREGLEKSLDNRGHPRVISTASLVSKKPKISRNAEKGVKGLYIATCSKALSVSHPAMPSILYFHSVLSFPVSSLPACFPSPFKSQV